MARGERRGRATSPPLLGGTGSGQKKLAVPTAIAYRTGAVLDVLDEQDASGVGVVRER